MQQNASSSSGRLFFAVVPDADTAVRIHRLARALKCAHKFDRKIIEPQLLHVSLFFLGELSEQIVRLAREAGAGVQAEPFELWFDRSASFRGRPGSRPFVLVGDEGVGRLRSFRRALGTALATRGLRRLANRD